VHRVAEVLQAQAGESVRAGIACDGGSGADPALACEERAEVCLLGAVDEIRISHWSSLPLGVLVQGLGRENRG
jgi:hypothetical protein